MLLEYAEKEYHRRLAEIARQYREEQAALLTALAKRKAGAEAEAKRELESVKRAVLDAAPASLRCALCEQNVKIMAAKCLEKKCGAQACADCLATVGEGMKCGVCGGGGGRSGPAGHVQNFLCAPCVAKRGQYFFALESCQSCDMYLCPEHTRTLKCCVCDGGRGPMCTGCEMERCERCGAYLCGRCKYKEGCMCAGKSGRRLLMEALGEWG